MLKPHRFPPALAFPAVIFIIIGIALAGGGVPLVILGGSWYYVITGVTIALTGVLLYIRRRSALWLFALVLFGSTIWAIAEARFDFLQLLPRLWVWLLLALWLLWPTVAGKLVFGPPGCTSERCAAVGCCCYRDCAVGGWDRIQSPVRSVRYVGVDRCGSNYAACGRRPPADGRLDRLRRLPVRSAVFAARADHTAKCRAFEGRLAA